MSSYAWYGSVDQFLVENDVSLLEKFQIHHKQCNQSNASESQIRAWRDSWQVMKSTFQMLINLHIQVRNWMVVFEYELPRERGRRPDVVVLTDRMMSVIEFKGYQYVDKAHVDQVQAYARDFVAYHSTTRMYGYAIAPFLVLTRTESMRTTYSTVQVVSSNFLADALWSFHERGLREMINPQNWIAGEYEPLPSLVSAARMIFRHEPFPQIRRAMSSGIENALQYALDCAKQAEERNEHHLVFITGVPGAGKTLVGIRFVYEYAEHDAKSISKAIMLSGNGPLVSVLQHALKSRVFVQDVHGFLKEYTKPNAKIPNEHIVIYDEAQRAWDAERSSEKRGTELSEPDDFLLIGSRHKKWSMMIALIGQGQEIHLGEEAGMPQWNDAISNARQQTGTEWIVHTPPRLASVFHNARRIHEAPYLDLNASLRSHVAEDVQEWVALLLNNVSARDVAGQQDNLAQSHNRVQSLAKSIKEQGFVLYITRDLELAKRYVWTRYADDIDKRYGLIASSKAKCLPQFGIPNDYFSTTRGFREGPWFNDEPTSMRSCCQLTAVATEFACQGLELDMPIVCWGEDVRFDGGHWRTPAQKRSKAKNPHQLRINAYRVLLSRGRDGMIIYMPPLAELDATYAVLIGAGCEVLSTDTVSDMGEHFMHTLAL
jgi:hypothetical protein